MTFLVAILSCVKHALDGSNQAARDTWLKELPMDYDYRFIIGDGTPTGDDETFLNRGWEERIPNFRKCYSDPELNFPTQVDELVLRIPDTYRHVSYKVREACRWGLVNGAQWIFFCTTDTYVVPYRLAESGFGPYDYVGHAFALPHPWTFACLGNGAWLSRRAAQIVADASVDEWISDSWVGKVLHVAGLKLQHDPRYTSLGAGQFPPMADNIVITSHICDSPKVYDSKQMYELHYLRKFSFPQVLRIINAEDSCTQQ
jgi:hypothetical protein